MNHNGSSVPDNLMQDLMAVLGDPAKAGALSLEALVAMRRELRRVDAELEAVVLLRMFARSGAATATAQPDGADRYLTMQEVAERTGLSLSHVYEMARLGRLPAKRMGSGAKGRAYRVLLSDLRVWEQGRSLVADEPLRAAVESMNRTPRRPGGGKAPRRAA